MLGFFYKKSETYLISFINFFSNVISENNSACFLHSSGEYFFSELFLSKIIKFSTKSSQFAELKNSHVFHSITVSSNQPALKANTGFHVDITSIGTIQKSSSPGNISPCEFCTKFTKLSQY
jgi:hypothetical protein